MFNGMDMFYGKDMFIRIDMFNGMYVLSWRKYTNWLPIWTILSGKRLICHFNWTLWTAR
jgi:hypothetical protein